MDLYLGIAVVIATIAGPILAVLVTRHIDRTRDRNRRREEVFRMLMRTRRATLSIDHVTALNMIEIEFYGVPAVLAAFKNLYEHFHNTGAPAQEWWDKRAKLQTRLLTEMAKSLGYKLEQLDVLEGGYIPQGWNTTETEQQQMRQLLIELLSGKRSIPVRRGAPPPPFPPPAPPPP